MYNAEDEGTGGDGYNQPYQPRSNFEYGYGEEGAVAVGSLEEDDEGVEFERRG